MHYLQKQGLRLGLPVLIGAALLGSFFLWRSRPNSAIAPQVEPLPQDPYIQAYFNHSEANVYTEPYRQVTRLGDDLEQVVVDAILQADSTVDVAVQELRLPGVAQALRDRAQAGVQVRVIIEHDYSRPWSSYSAAEVGNLDSRDRSKYEEFVQLADRDQDGTVSATERDDYDALHIIQTADIPWIDDTADGSKGSDLMHHKFIIIDGRTVVTGSANLTTSGVHGDARSAGSMGNPNSLLVIESPGLASIFTQEFDLMWGDGMGGQPDSLFGLQKPYRPAQTVTLPNGTTVDVQFSPTSSSRDWSESVNGLIARSLSPAAQSIDLALFVFSDQPISDSLQSIAQQGVPIRALIDAGFAYRDYSEGLDMLGVAMPSHRCQIEADNRPWTSPITTVGVPTLAQGDVLHHKFGVVDGETVIIGSQNWSKAANFGNDENLLVIRNPTVAAHYSREFERLYRTAAVGLTTDLQDRLQDRQQKCQ